MRAHERADLEALAGVIHGSETTTLNAASPAARALYRLSAAVHEAAHAVIGRALGLSCGRATIIRNVREGHEGFARIDDPYYTWEDWEQRGRWRDFDTVLLGHIIATMAGREAECELLERDVAEIGDAYDLREIEIMVGHGSRPIDLARARKAARRLVIYHQEKIWAVANALAEHRQISAWRSR
jgi:hypothetical protein